MTGHYAASVFCKLWTMIVAQRHMSPEIALFFPILANLIRLGIFELQLDQLCKCDWISSFHQSDTKPVYQVQPGTENSFTKPSVPSPQITASNSLSRKQNISQTIFLPKKKSWKGCTASNSQQAVLSEQKCGGRGKEALSRKVAGKAGRRRSASQSCKKGVGGKLHTILEVVCEPVWKYTIHPLYFSLLSSSYLLQSPFLTRM